MNAEYETSRLVLKILPPVYSQEVLRFQLRNREQFERYEPQRPENFYTTSHQQAVLKCEYKLATKLSTIRFYVFLKGRPHTIIGTVCLHDILRQAYSCCEIGYKFDYEYQHQGYAREAVQKAIDIAFSALSLHRIFARVMPENTASIRLLSDLCFSEEGMERSCIKIRGKWTDHIRYALIAPESYTAAHSI